MRRIREANVREPEQHNARILPQQDAYIVPLRKLARELNASIQGTDYKGQLIELKQEKRYNKLVDEFKQTPQIFAKRNFKHVLTDIKNHKRNRIHLEIPVERTDPPTVSHAKVADRLGDINIQNYTIAFSVTTTTQKLDEDGNLESERVDTSPEAPIQKLKGKRNAGAITGFLNRYLIKVMKSLTYVNKVNLFLTKRVNQPKKLTPNFDGLQMNCLINIADQMVRKRKDYKTKLQPRLQALNEKYLQTGAAEEAVDEICKAVQVNIHIVSVLQETWYHKHLGDNKLTILVCSHNGHATWLNETKDMMDYLDPEKTKKVNYVDNLTEHFMNNSAPIKFPIVIKDQIVAYFENDTLFKNRDVFFDGDDFEKNKENKELFNVFTLTSRYYREMKMKYRLQDTYRNEDLYHFVKCADQYTPPWCTDPDYAENGQAFDQDRAYMFYERSEYYEHYQFPRMPTHFYKVTQQQQQNAGILPQQDEMLKLTGFAQVENVSIPARDELTYLRRTQMLQSGGVYTTMRLAWARKLGVTFDICKIAFSNDKQKLDFHIKLTEWQMNADISAKLEECALMGRLIPNQNGVHTSLVHCRDENEFLQLRYQLGSRVLNVDFDKKIIYFTKEQVKRLRGAYHIHAFILDYQQIEFATKAMSVPFEHILKVKVDCLVLERPTLFTVAKDLHRRYFKQTRKTCPWKVSAIVEWMEMMPIKITELKGFEAWHDADLNPSQPKWVGFHEEHAIKDCKTAHIDEVDFTHRRYLSNVQLSEFPSVAMHKFTEVTGAAGCAKTYTATHWNLWDACILVPTHALRVKFQQENPGMPCETYHKAFNTNAKKGDWTPERTQYSTYILDECSMICKGVMNNILTHKNATDANIVIIHDRAQLAALTPDNSHWEDPKTRYFTFGKEYKARTWHQIHLTQQMRQNDPAFIDILTQLRSLQDQPAKAHFCPLKEMVDLLKDRIIPEKEAVELYRMDTKDIVIASTNEEVDRWNALLLKRAKPGELKLKYTNTTQTHANNERVIMQTEQTDKQVLAFAATVHLVQGLTFTDRLFISLSLLKKNCNFDPHLFYTAVSRVKTVANLYLVQ